MRAVRIVVVPHFIINQRVWVNCWLDVVTPEADAILNAHVKGR
jgi:hypothetical protein